MSRLKKGDKVKVISGKDKGVIGEIKSFNRSLGKVVVEGVAIVRKHQKPSQTSQGGIISKEMPINVSNVMYYDEDSSSTSRLGMKLDDEGYKVRYVKKTGRIINRVSSSATAKPSPVSEQNSQSEVSEA